MGAKETAVQYIAPKKGHPMFSWKVVFQGGEIKRVPEDISRAQVVELMRVFPGRFFWVDRPREEEPEKSYQPTGNKAMRSERNK